MGRVDAKTDDGTPLRCHSCRYWFARCCHALALLEGDDRQPMRCSHFMVESARPAPLMEASP